jgi:hypothetical protein
MLTLQQFAEQLNGKEYCTRLFTDAEIQTAKDNGFIIAYGASDDLLELRGAITEEFGAYDGGECHIINNGVYSEDVYNKIKNAVNLVGLEMPKTVTVVAEWAPEKDGECYASWHIHVVGASEVASFDVLEDDELFCRACVFKI